MATRKELEAEASELGIANPESFANMDELQKAIDQGVPKENESEANTQTTEGENPEQLEDTTANARETAQENHDAVQTEDDEEAPSGAELDGTAELEETQDVASERSKVLREGRETARENAAREREENQVEGE